jgi:hypothetical protein
MAFMVSRAKKIKIEIKKKIRIELISFMTIKREKINLTRQLKGS